MSSALSEAEITLNVQRCKFTFQIDALSDLQKYRSGRERGRLRSLDRFHRLVGKFYRGRSDCADAQGVRSRNYSVRCGRYLWKRTKRGADRQGVPKTARPNYSRDQGRLRFRPPRPGPRSWSTRDPARFFTGSHRARDRRGVETVEDRSCRSSPTAQHSDGTGLRRRALENARETSLSRELATQSWTGGIALVAGRRARGFDAAEYLQPRTADRIRQSARLPAAGFGRSRQDRQSLFRKLRR